MYPGSRTVRIVVCGESCLPDWHSPGGLKLTGLEGAWPLSYLRSSKRKILETSVDVLES